MTFKQYLVIMSIATLLCWVAWGFVLFSIDPFFGTAASFIFFYCSLFLSLVGTISILACALLYRFSRESLPMYRYVQKSFHVAFVFATALIVLLFLQGSRLLNMWVGTLYIISFALLVTTLTINKKQTDIQSPSFHL